MSDEWRTEAEDVLRELREIISDERDGLIESYCTPPRVAKLAGRAHAIADYDIETIDDRHAYNAVIRYGELIEIIDRLAPSPPDKGQTE